MGSGCLEPLPAGPRMIPGMEQLPPPPVNSATVFPPNSHRNDNSCWNNCNNRIQFRILPGNNRENVPWEPGIRLDWDFFGVWGEFGAMPEAGASSLPSSKSEGSLHTPGGFFPALRSSIKKLENKGKKKNPTPRIKQ